MRRTKRSSSPASFNRVDGAKRLRLVILDACRDNPFLATMKRQRQANASGRLPARPVGDVGSETSSPNAAKQGSTAEDGKGDHSPLHHRDPAQPSRARFDIRLAFGRVRDEGAQDHQQSPGAVCVRLASAAAMSPSSRR